MNNQQNNTTLREKDGRTTESTGHTTQYPCYLSLGSVHRPNGRRNDRIEHKELRKSETQRKHNPTTRTSTGRRTSILTTRFCAIPTKNVSANKDANPKTITKSGNSFPKKNK